MSDGKVDKSRLGILSAIAIGFVLALYCMIIIGLIAGWQNGWLYDEWQSLGKEGRGSVISSGITAMALLSSAVLLPFIFKDRVRDLSDMVQKTEKSIEQLDRDTRTQLSSLQNEFRGQIENLNEESRNRSQEGALLLKEFQKAINSLYSQGQIMNSSHAETIVDDLWNKAKSVCQERVENKSGMRATTRNEINESMFMSSAYLDRLEQKRVIDKDEREMLSNLSKMWHLRRVPDPSEFPTILNVQRDMKKFAKREDY
ncbi:MAG: hypothetical protein AAFO74_09140 [Pseudomonadota bacterium]